MGRPPGSRKKKSLAREQRICEAARLARVSENDAVWIDSLQVMEAAMQYFFGRFQAGMAEKTPDDAQVRADILDAIAIAKIIAAYRHPRVATMRLATDPRPEIQEDFLRRFGREKRLVH
jgi:hypothetical protein